MKRLVSVFVSMLIVISVLIPAYAGEWQAEITDITIIDDDQETCEKYAVMYWEQGSCLASQSFINDLWNMGIDDPYWDLLACCNYSCMSEDEKKLMRELEGKVEGFDSSMSTREKSLMYGLRGFEKLNWTIGQDVPDLYTDFLWGAVFWSMGQNYYGFNQFETAIPYLEKCREYEDGWNKGTIYSLEIKLWLLKRLEYCYRYIGDREKQEEIILLVQNSDEYDRAVQFWEETGTTAVGNNNPSSFYHYAMDYTFDAR